MTDTQSATPKSQTTIDDARALSRRSFIAALKANRDVFSNLPERIEQWLEKETRATNQPGTSEHGRDESERLARPDMEKQLECLQTEINANTQSLMTLDQTVREMTAAFETMKSEHSSMVFTRDRCVERELKEKEDTIEANKEQLKLVEEENLKLKEELKKEEKEAKDKITKQEERIARLEGEQEKKEMQIVEIAREEKEKTEDLKNEHQKEVDKFLREIQTMKEKLLKKNDYIQKMYEDYNKNLADHKSRTEGLTNEHQKEVDKLLSEIQTMKKKNDTLLREKEEEIAKYTQMNLKLKEELKKKEKEAKDKIKEREERIVRLESEQKKKEKQIVEIAREEKEKTEGLTNEHRKEVDKLFCEIQTMKEKEKELKGKCKALLESKDEELKEIKIRMKELKEKCQALLESKDEELKDVKIRLAQLSQKLTKKDQRKIEDTTAANRPSEVQQDYHEFFDNERMDAIEKMQNIFGSEEVKDIDISYPRLACMIFEAAYEQTLEAKESALHVFKEIINDMIDKAPKLGSEQSSADKDKILPYIVTFKVSAYSQELKYPTEVLDALELSLKETAQLCNLESMEMGVRRKITEKWISWLNSEKSCQFSFSDHLLLRLKDYVRACLRLTWRMAVQVPPMQLEYKCTTLKNFHRMVGYHSGPEMCSMPPPNGQGAADYEVACYLWPALLDGGGRVIRPGEVLCKVRLK